MKAINVSGIYTLKKYPIQSLELNEGYLTDTQTRAVFSRQQALIRQLTKSNEELLNRMGMRPKPTPSEAQLTAAQAEVDRAEASSKLAAQYLDTMRKILNKETPPAPRELREQPDIFVGVPVGRPTFNHNSEN
jgi:hypothetical protein